MHAAAGDPAPSSLPAAALLATVIVVGAAVRLLLAATVGLSVDESYAVFMARRLEASYFDHPPAMFWLAGLAARVAGEAALAVRLPFILLFACTTWLLDRGTTLLFGADAGGWAALLLNLCLFFTVCAGAFVLPDGPLLCASAAALVFLARALFHHQPGVSGLRDWLGFGLCGGFALLSKYHAFFLFAGTALFLATSPPHRGWLRRAEPYAACGVALVVFSPVLLWNLFHDWVSFRFQGGRVTPLEGEGGTPFLDGLLGQAAWLLPWLWLPLLAVLGAALRRGPREPRRWLLACLALGPIAGFALLTAAGTRALSHWTMPGFFMLLPLLGAHLGTALARRDLWRRRWLAAAVTGSALVVAALATHAATGWLGRALPALLARGDPTDDLVDWKQLRPHLARWGYPRTPIVVASTLWSDGAKLAYALGPSVPVACVGGDPRGFRYVIDQRSLLGRDLLLVVRRRPGPEPMTWLAPYFQRIQPLGSFSASAERPERVVLSVYLGRRLLATVPPKRTL